MNTNKVLVATQTAAGALDCRQYDSAHDFVAETIGTFRVTDGTDMLGAMAAHDAWLAELAATIAEMRESLREQRGQIDLHEPALRVAA